LTFFNVTYDTIIVPNVEIVGFPNIFNVLTYIFAIIGLFSVIKYIWEHTYVHARSAS
jgi:hypothetical protein